MQRRHSKKGSSACLVAPRGRVRGKGVPTRRIGHAASPNNALQLTLDSKKIDVTMKVLFVCYYNVGRSQVAEACFKKLSQHDCDSAGIAVDETIAQRKLPSKKLKDNLI
jgi:hypothetical protein